MRNKYIFAYGSLINHESRNKNMPNVEVIYGKIDSYKRSWCISVTERNFTALGLIKDATSHCNGVYIPATNEDIKSFDKREIEGSGYKYERVLVQREFCDDLFKDDEVYTYISIDNNLSNICPLIESYIDVVISGCLDYNYEFAEEFIKNTSNWNSNWINDRKNILYSNPKRLDDYYDDIDELLKKNSLLSLRKEF